MSQKDEDIAVRVSGLFKSFDLPENKLSSLKQAFVNLGKPNKKHRQEVLSGISFEVKKGDFFGIVGRNGSGKSTLLKILAGVYTPDEGGVFVNGNLTPFIELGVGFNPELSGRDNVYLSASLLGYTRKQVDAMYDDIVDFAELHEHMDKKLKNYSSGMQVRLAFSIAIKAKNDILIFDEVLAVGDEAFQQKCYKVFEDHRKQKQTVILVTHSMDNIRRFCTRAMMISDGKIIVIGDVKRVANAYIKSNQPQIMNDSPQEKSPEPDKGSLVSVEINQKSYRSGDELIMKIRWPEDLGVDQVGVSIFSERDEYVFGSSTDGEVGVASFGMDYDVNLNLGPGKYYAAVAIKDKDVKLIERVEKAIEFTIEDDFRPEVGGLALLKYSYSVPTSNN